MMKPVRDDISQFVDEIISKMPLEERVYLANVKQKDVEVLQGVFDLYIRSKVDADDEECENIMHELWKRVRENHRLRVVK
jgi:hypothetical protein